MKYQSEKGRETEKKMHGKQHKVINKSKHNSNHKKYKKTKLTI